MKFHIRRLSILLFILLFSGINLAQQPETDKLRQQISKETNDTIKAKLLINLALNYSHKEYERLGCLSEAYSLSKHKKYKYGLAWGQFYDGMLLLNNYRYEEAITKYKSCIDALDSLGIVHPASSPLFLLRLLFNHIGKQEEKFMYYSKKLAFYKKHGPIENTAYCYHAIAEYYRYCAAFDKAIEYYLRARDVFKSFDPVNCAREKETVGTAYMEWGNLDNAEVYLQSALKDLKSLNENCFISYHQLGDIYFERQAYKKALHFYFEGKKYAHDPQFQAIHMVNCAAAYLQENYMDSAIFYLDSAEMIRQKDNLRISYTQGNLEIDYNFYKYYVATRNSTQALQYLKAALKGAQREKFIPLIMKYTKEINSCMLKKGDSLEALRYLIRYHAIQDSTAAMNIKARIASFEIEQQQQQKEDEIQQLQIQKTSQRNYYLITGALLLLIVLAILSRLRYKRKRDREQLASDFKKQLAQAETKALRAQMNPHFIFNSLNSINSFVMDQKHEIASEYLIKFSKLIRLILDNSRSETISIEKELETLKLYVLLEAARFDNRFKCVYHIADEVDTSSIMIPPMLLQPFVENAIWHGLMQKEGEGTITVEIQKQDEEFLNISITDNGIGREKAAELKSKSATHKSHGLKVTSQRIEMMNRLNSSGAKVNIADLKDEQGRALGTRVELIIPF